MREGHGPTGNGQEGPFSGRLQPASSETPVSLILKKTQVYGLTFVANNPSAPHRCLTHLLMSKFLSLEISSAPQPCLGHPVAPAWLRLQKFFITNTNYHSGFIIASPSGCCLCCLETTLKATRTRSITHLGTKN